MNKSLSELLAISAQDFFSKPILLRLLVVVLFSIFLVYLSTYFLVDYLYTFSTTIDGDHYSASTVADEFSADLKTIPYIGIALAFIVAKIALILLSVAALFAGYYLTIVFSLIVAGLLTKNIVQVIVLRRGGSLSDIGSFDNIASAMLKVTLIFVAHILLLIMMLPLLLIPGFNIFLIFIVMYSLFKTVLVYDVSSNMFNRGFHQKTINFWDRDLLLISLIGYAVSYIPIVGLFASIFTVILICNYFYYQYIEV